MQRSGGISTSRVLVVEDDGAIATTLIDFLSDCGYEVEHAGTWAAARGALDRALPDLIILDLQLPDADGLVLCQHLRQTRGIPIVICSASLLPRDRVLGLK